MRDAYDERYKAFAQGFWLNGLTICVYQHSTVARDVLVELGATCLAFARSDDFIPVDTEAHLPEDVALGREWTANRVDAIVSADGDADRPLLGDAAGNFLRGDPLGLLTALALGADTVMTPVTSTSAIEQSGMFKIVRRTRVGSPYVIEGIGKGRRHHRRLRGQWRRVARLGREHWRRETRRPADPRCAAVDRRRAGPG